MTDLELYNFWHIPFYHAMFIVLVVNTFIIYWGIKRNSSTQLICSLLVTLSVALYMGFAPVPINSGADREIYKDLFLLSQNPLALEGLSDKLFIHYSRLMSLFVDYQMWFIITSMIYCVNHFTLAYNVVKENHYILLLMLFTSFMFYPYGVNTIRAGFASSFLLLSLAYYQRRLCFFIFILVAVGCHFSMLIPSAALILSRYYNKTKLYFYVWLLAIPLSAAMGHSFETLFAGMTSDSRVSYLAVDAEDTHYKVGFRVDFLLYSCVPVLMGYYYIFKKHVKDSFYTLVFNTYLLANCFWILVIRANFSDRFAYLSWFMYPIVIAYPALKYKIWQGQNKKVAMIFFLHGLFTYLMFLR